MCPANITRGRPPRLTVANELPLTSPSTPSAKRSASVRHSRAGADSKADGPGVSSSDFRNVSESGFMVTGNLAPPGEVELEILGPGDRVGAIWRNGEEAELRVQRSRCVHGWKSVESHPLVSRLATLGDDPLHQ